MAFEAEADALSMQASQQKGGKDDPAECTSSHGPAKLLCRIILRWTALLKAVCENQNHASMKLTNQIPDSARMQQFLDAD